MDLFDAVRTTRREQGLSQEALAERLGVRRLAVTRLEQGIGSAALLLRAMDALAIRLSGIARGSTLPVQLTTKRARTGLSVEQIAKAAGLDPRTIIAVEEGHGSAASLARVLAAIAPHAAISNPPRASWAYDPATTGERDKRFTPKGFLEHLVAVFGQIDLDPCAHPASSVVARRRIILPECGLSASWNGHRFAYINPPFSAVTRWFVRAAEAWDCGEVGRMVMLVPARTDSEIYQVRVTREAHTLFLRGRMRFESPAGISWPAPFSLMLVIWGASDDELRCLIERVPGVLMRAHQ